MKLSARNQLRGKVVDVKKGATTTIVKIDVSSPSHITASITNEAAEAEELSGLPNRSGAVRGCKPGGSRHCGAPAEKKTCGYNSALRSTLLTCR